MSGHPLHGTKPQAAKLRLACDWGEATSITPWKVRWKMPGSGRGAWRAALCLSTDLQSVVLQLSTEGKEVEVSRL